ncbi:hypothetical protein, partial [Legionella sp. 29fVS95]|uniref:hypothetical protein n=1 Tax=Legionella sp. 29fVS95 TaxID=3402813 RepID=UPI003AF4132C
YSFADDGMFLPDKVYYVPLEEALQNIANFIAKHQPILALREPSVVKFFFLTYSSSESSPI